jgi:hypothetical protein
MTRKVKWSVTGIASVVLLALVVAAVVVRPSRASLGNRGIPVYGRLPGPVPETETYTMRFTAADGTAFDDGEAVPDGYYLLITDIVMTTDGGRDASAVVSVRVSDESRWLRLRSTDNATLNLNYTTPYFILEAGDRLAVGNAWYSDKWAYVNVSGLLVTNVSYLPYVGQQ